MGLLEQLREELQRLKILFDKGHSLSVVHLPGEIRYSEGVVLSGEVQGDIILIYESTEEKAISTLYHEFIEAVLIVPLVKQCYKVMHHQQKMLAEKDEIIHRLLMQSKESVVDGLSIPIRKMVESISE